MELPLDLSASMTGGQQAHRPKKGKRGGEGNKERKNIKKKKKNNQTTVAMI